MWQSSGRVVIFAIFVHLVLVSPLGCKAQLDEIALRDMKLFVNGREFIVKGIAYQPVPLGYQVGAGLCSVRQTPYSEWVNACFDSDYFDGSVITRTPAGPPGGWFKGLWDRDLPLLKQAGVNTIRVYLANAITRDASVAQLGTNLITSPTGKYHVPFFDAAYAYGMKIIWPLVSDRELILSTPTATFQLWLRNQIDEIGNHPALLMYSLGNELPLNGVTAAGLNLVNKVNTYVDYARAYQAQKWQRWIPISTALIDANQHYDFLAANMRVDVMMLNIYRGLGFSDLWSGREGVTEGWRSLTCKYNMPTLLGELGWHQTNNAYNIQNPTWWNQLYWNVLKNIDQGLIGSVFFEYSDEPFKTAVDQQTMGIVRFTPATAGGQSSATSPDFWTPDVVVRKTDVNIWTSFVSGAANGVPCNFNTDEYAIIGRAQATYAQSFSVCEGYVTAATTAVPTVNVGANVATTTAQLATELATVAAMTSTSSVAATTAAAATTRAVTTTNAATTTAVAASTTKAAATTSQAVVTTTRAASSTTTAAVTSTKAAATTSNAITSAQSTASRIATSTASASTTAKATSTASQTTSQSVAFTTAEATTTTRASSTTLGQTTLSTTTLAHTTSTAAAAGDIRNRLASSAVSAVPLRFLLLVIFLSMYCLLC